MRVISVQSQKGGTGKSTVATHLASGLALRGYRVVLIDTDPQGDAARLLGMVERDDLFHWIVEDWAPADVLRAVPEAAYVPEGATCSGALLLMASGRQTPMVAIRQPDAWRLRDKLEQIAPVADFVVIDTAPTLSPLDAYVRLAVDGVVFVTEVEALALNGLAAGLDELGLVNQFRQQSGVAAAAVLGIVPNKVRPNTMNHRMLLADLARAHGDGVWVPVVQRTAWTEASNFGEMVFRYKPVSYETDEANRLVGKLLEVCGEN